MTDWRCRQHPDRPFHDVFINYRVQTDGDLAEKLALVLNSQKKWDGTDVCAFLDKHCLNDGEPWEEGFLKGLERSSLIVLLISEGGIRNIEKANERKDNVLLEYEYAMEFKAAKKCMVLPVFITEELGGSQSGMLKPFSAFNCGVYPHATHMNGRSENLIFQTMSEVFSLQGIHINPRDVIAVVPKVVSKINEASEMLSRLGPKQNMAIESGDIELTVDDCCALLQDWGLGQYHSSFKENCIDGEMMLSVANDKDLTDLGIDNRFHRRNILMKIQKLEVEVRARKEYKTRIKELIQSGVTDIRKDGSLNALRVRLNLDQDIHEKIMSQFEVQNASSVADAIAATPMPSIAVAPKVDLPYKTYPLSDYTDDGIHWFINKNYPGLICINKDPFMFLVPNFYTPEECDGLMRKAGLRMEPAKIPNQKDSNSIRTAMSMRIPYDETPKVHKRHADLLNMNVNQFEPIKISNYPIGGQFTRHYDPQKSSYAGGVKCCTTPWANRVATCITYLTTQENGGRTQFPDLNPPIEIAPVQGMCLVFLPTNIKTGNRDTNMVHVGLPTETSSKWIAQQWCWTGKFDVKLAVKGRQAYDGKCTDEIL